MSEIEVEFPKGTKFKVKGASKFVIVAIVLIFLGFYLVTKELNLFSLVTVLSAMLIFLLVGAAIMERQQRKFGRLIH